MSLWDEFKNRCDTIKNPKIIEFGTKKYGQKSTHRRDCFFSSSYTLADFQEGEDVDVVIDLHKACEQLSNKGMLFYDIVIACSVFEHVEKPWIAADEILKILRPGGLFFISSHQTFPVHAYPNDYFRFSDQGFKSLFSGASFSKAEMTNPCKILPNTPMEVWCNVAPAYLNSDIWGVK